MEKETEEEGGFDTWDKRALMAGDFVVKVGGDFKFRGYVVAVFWMQSGRIRYVVENEDKILMIFKQTELVKT